MKNIAMLSAVMALAGSTAAMATTTVTISCPSAQQVSQSIITSIDQAAQPNSVSLPAGYLLSLNTPGSNTKGPVLVNSPRATLMHGDTTYAQGASLKFNGLRLVEQPHADTSAGEFTLMCDYVGLGKSGIVDLRDFALANQVPIKAYGCQQSGPASVDCRLG